VVTVSATNTNADCLDHQYADQEFHSGNSNAANWATGRARHSVRAVVCLAKPGAHGVTHPTSRLRKRFANVTIGHFCGSQSRAPQKEIDFENTP